MATILKDLTIQTTPERVWAALTQPDEIGHWWTNDLNVKSEVGSIAEFRFGEWGEFVIRFEIAELVPDKYISWITRRGPSTGHWAGTSVTWQLEAVEGGTKLVFTHDHFAQADRRFDITRAWWEHFLDSLKSYLETGKGMPGSVAISVEQGGTTTSAIIERYIIAAAPERVWVALTNPDDITHWWASEARIIPKVGTLAEFRFRPPAGMLQFEIAALEPERRMRWTTRQGPPHWDGTSVTWYLEPIQGGTKVMFAHEGFATIDEIYEQKRGNWRYFLDSLKSYLETGQGTPGTPPSVASGHVS